MRILQNTLYVTSADAYLSLDGENAVILHAGQEVRRVPLHNLEGIITFGYTGASPALMGACAKRGIALTFLTAHGRFLARVTGDHYGNVLLRKDQYRISDSEAASLSFARQFITGKLFQCRWVLERACRDYAMRLDVDKLKTVSAFLAESIRLVRSAETLDELRGYEGAAAVRYFEVLDDLILRQKETFYLHGRNRRPPLDAMNALLSFIYTLLMHDTAAALESVGLDPYVGFLHRDRPGRMSLALDLMEEFRPVLGDRFALTLVNTLQIDPSGFTQKENGAVMMDDETRKTILAAWQAKKSETMTHPYLQEKIEWGLVPYSQALLMTRYLRGDLDAYPPLLWK